MGTSRRALRARSIRTNRVDSISAPSLVILLILSTMVGLIGTVSASPATEDISIDSGVMPIAGAHYDFNEMIFPIVTINNDLMTATDTRQIKVEICEGDRTSQQSCPSGSATEWSLTNVPPLGPLESVNVEFNNIYFYPTTPGVHTVVFTLIPGDIDTSDDKLVYTFHFDQPLRDLIVNGHNVDTQHVFNSATQIEAALDVQGRSWMPEQSFTTDWSMHLIDSLVAEANDCVEWDMFYTGAYDMNGPVINHTYTHMDSTFTIHRAPYEVSVTVGNDSGEILADIDVTGSEFDSEHTVEVIASLNGTELYSYWFNFTGDGAPHSQRLFTDFANGTICFTAFVRAPDIEVASASHIVSGYSGTFSSQFIPLPNITAPEPGEYLIRAGIADAFIDPNLHNDRISFPMVFNDSVDVWIREVIPARGPVTYVEDNGQLFVRYPYGDDSIRIVPGNIGYMTTTSRVELLLNELVGGNTAAGPYTCEVTLQPEEESRCDFDIDVTGNFVMNVSITPIDGGIDVLPADNWFEQLITINYGTTAPVVANPLANSVFETGENILAVAGTDPLSPMPLNFTWKLNYLDILGYGQVTNITLPMGEWTLTLFVEDAFGNVEIATQPVRILNRVEFVQAPYILNGLGVSTYAMEYDWDDPQLPMPNRLYPAAFNKDKSPLMMFNLSMQPLLSGDFDIDTLDVWLDIDAMLPDTINLSTVEILRIPDWNTTDLTEFSEFGDTYAMYENGSGHISISSDIGGSFMVIGELPPIVVNPDNLDIVLKKDGQVTVAWDNGGDVDNPYFGGWRLYRKTDLLFAYPFTSQSQFNAATTGYELVDLSPETTSWDDPTYWEQGTCLSYLVLSTSRAGVTDWHHGNVTRGTWNEITERMDVEEICVDALPPTSQVVNFDSEITFNNDTNSKLHSVHLSWTWPEIDEQGPLTWNLYRAELTVTSVRYMEPLATGLSGVPGEMSWFNQTEGGLNEDIHLSRYYYYVLIPFDIVGNSDYLVRSGNAQGIIIEDQFWDYHQEPPPPPPPPPPELPLIGPSPWYGKLLEDIDSEQFQLAAMVSVGVLLMNLMLVPMLINKYRDQKRKARRKAAIQRRRREELGLDDFADDFDEFFD